MVEKDKEHEKQHEIVKAGDKYHCGECGSEVHLGNDCPGCNKEFDWSKVEIYVRR